MIGKRESEGEWDREGKKLNDMERKTRKAGSRGRRERDLHMTEENGQKQSWKICRTTGVCR